MSDNNEKFIDELLNKPRRKGSAGRPADKKAAEHQKFIAGHYSYPPDLHERLTRYCADEERAMSWVIQKALDMWLGKKGY